MEKFPIKKERLTKKLEKNFKKHNNSEKNTKNLEKIQPYSEKARR